jgi:predicted O-methyltransferase YrrM
MSNTWDNWRPEIDGWSSDILPYYEAISEELPDGAQIAEVGVYQGRSLLYLAERLAARGKTGCTIFAVDRFEADWCPAMWERFSENLAATEPIARRLVTVCRGSSAMISFGWSFTLDMVFIDGDHNYESVRDDIAAWRPRVKTGGIISGHDYSGDMYGSFPGVDQAVHEAFGKDNVLKPSGSVWRIR